MTAPIHGPPPTRQRSQPDGPIIMVLVIAVVAVLGVASVVIVRAAGAYPRQASTIISDFPFTRPSVPPVNDPNPALAVSPAVAATKSSVIKIHGVAPSCQKVLAGSGFVVAPNRVLSAAHVVAGAAAVTVEGDGRTYDATVVSYDSSADVTILAVPNLPASPLQFDTHDAYRGTDAIILGYPGGGDFTATPARIRGIIELSGSDLYHTKTVTRQTYAIRGSVRQGNSGGPLIGRGGAVLGIAFGAAVDDADTGFALTAKEVERQLARVGNTAPVATGACVR